MPKLSWKQASNLRKKSTGNSVRDINFKEVFLYITPDIKPDSETSNTIRFVSPPTPYFVHWPNKKDADGKLQKYPFPDAELNRRKTRVCFSTIGPDNKIVDDPNCPWCQMGYSRQLRFMVNVISRDNGGKLMILDAPPDVINDVFEWVEAAEEDELENTDPSAWDKPAPDFRIKATRMNGGSIQWRTTATTKLRKLTEDDLNAIRAINPDAKNDEEALKLYPLETFTRPTPLKTDANVANSDSNSSSVDNDDNNEDIYAETKSSYSKAAVINPYSDSDDDSEEDEDDIEPIRVTKSVMAPVGSCEDNDNDDTEYADDDDDWD